MHHIFDFPITSPELKFLIILGIILIAPLILDRFRVPHILGLIIAGAMIGEFGFNLLERDSGIVMSGTAGLLYIMFLAGLEIDINEFIKNRWRSIVFGLYTFGIPMIVGTVASLYLLEFPMMTSILLASMFASHTLLTYPIISKLGVKRNRAVTIAIGGTVIADTLALLVLAVVVGMTQGEVDAAFWLTLGGKFLLFAVVVFGLFPPIARFVLRRCSDGLMQYVFVLFMLFLGAVLAELAGVEGIIGALFTGLALNRLIPSSSALMNRIEFVGNAIFIPFFLIGVGMLINYRVLFDLNTVYVAFIMTTAAIITKYLAAYITQKSFGYTKDERSVIFGLSSARAAATLAVVLVGYNVGLFDSSVLNGTIVMIFITCSVASIAAQRGGYKLSMASQIDIDGSNTDEEDLPKILLPLNSVDKVGDMVTFANLIAPAHSAVTVASVVSDSKDENVQLSQSKKIFDVALHSASTLDRVIDTLMRYDTSYSNGISNIIRENNISDLIMSIHVDQEFSPKVIAKIINGTVHSSSVTTFMYRALQPLESVRRYVVVVPPLAEQEIGFRAWVIRLWSLLRATGATASIYATKETLAVLHQVNAAVSVPITTHEFTKYSDLLIVTKYLKRDDALVFVMSKPLHPSYDPLMEEMPHYINAHFNAHNFVLIYPYESGSVKGDLDGMINVDSVNVVARIEDMIESVIDVIKRGR